MSHFKKRLKFSAAVDPYMTQGAHDPQFFFQCEDEFLCSLIQHTNYCSCCASYRYSLPDCIIIHLYSPSSGVELAVHFVVFNGQLYAL